MESVKAKDEEGKLVYKAFLEGSSTFKTAVK